MAKSEPIGVRLEEDERTALAVLAHQEDRSVSAMARLLIVDGLKRRGLEWGPVKKAANPVKKGRKK